MFSIYSKTEKIISYNRDWHFLVMPKDMKHCIVVLIENRDGDCNLIVYVCSYILSAITRTRRPDLSS